MRTLPQIFSIVTIVVHVCAGIGPSEQDPLRSVQVSSKKHVRDSSHERGPDHHSYKKDKWQKNDHDLEQRDHYRHEKRKDGKYEKNLEKYHDDARKNDDIQHNDWYKDDERRYKNEEVSHKRERDYVKVPRDDKGKYHDDRRKYENLHDGDWYKNDERRYKKEEVSHKRETDYEKVSEDKHDDYDKRSRGKRDEFQVVQEKGEEMDATHRRDVENVAPRQLSDGRDRKVAIQYLPEFTTPPNPNDTILMARYIVHTVDWAGIATVTARGMSGPFGNVLSMSDGTEDKGSGVPYFYMTPMDLSTKDVMKDNKASIVVTLAQSDYCRSRSLALDPRCARLILSGKVKRVKPGSPEDEFARNALFTRHPVMRSWPADHGFFTAKLKIGQVILLDQLGGAKYLDVSDYLNPSSSATRSETPEP